MERRVIFSKVFLVSIISFIALCFMYKINIFGKGDINILKLAIEYDKKEMASYGEEFCSINIINAVRDFEWFCVIFPVITAFPFCYTFINEWKSSVYTMGVSRCGEKKYAVKSVRAAAISGMLVAAIGMICFMAIVLFLFPDVSYYEGKEELFGLASKADSEILRLLTKMLVNMMLQGMLSSVIAAVLLVFLNDIFYALTIPMIIMYLSTKLLNYYALWMFKNNVEDTPKSRIPVFLLPCEHIFMDLRLEQFKIRYLYYVIAMLFIVLALTYLFYLKLRRRRNV